MMKTNRFLFAGVLLAGLLSIPALADVNFTTTDDGRLHLSNGTNWITWDRIGDHDVGDQFFVNATTNISPGTVIEYEFFDPDQMCHTKVCSQPETGAGGLVTVEKGPVPGTNTVSVLINTTGFQASESLREDYYFFLFHIYSSDIPDEMNIFPAGYGVSIVNLSPAGTHSRSNPTPSPLPVTGTCGAVFLASVIILWIRRDGKHADRGEPK